MFPGNGVFVEWVEDRLGELGKIAGSHASRQRWKGRGTWRTAFTRGLPRDKKERFIPNDRTAECCAKLISS